MSDVSDFINWYMLQSFPSFSSEMLEFAAKFVPEGYEVAKAYVLSKPGAEMDRSSLAMIAVLNRMSEYRINPEVASYLLRKLNHIARRD